MRHRVRATVIKCNVDEDLQTQYLADPHSGPCPCFHVGDNYEFWREDDRDDFWHFGGNECGHFPCAEAWDCISRYIYAALQGGAVMSGWTNDERMMIACCNDGTRPVVFRIEREDVPETDEEHVWLARQDFSNGTNDTDATGA